MKSIINKLDLDGHINNLKKFYARDKDIKINGDITQHYRYIQALSKTEFPEIKEVKNLDIELNRIKKEAPLKLEDIYEFIKIVEYFNQLKLIEFENPLKKWIEKINIPDEILEIASFFTSDGKINPQKDIRLLDIEESLKKNKQDIKDILYKLVHSSKLRDYLVDTQIHLVDGEETLLMRGGFSNVINGSIIGRSSAGFFYILPTQISNLKSKETNLKYKREEILFEYSRRFSKILFKYFLFLRFINREYDRFDHYQARVRFAKAFDYEFILQSKKREVILSEFCHPAIKNPKPIDISLQKQIMIITGVNAGGKTMLLKSILSAVFFAKNLIPFRCNSKKTKIGEYKFIEAIIDDPQSVKNDISTFAGRVLEFSKLFKKSGGIVGVDEIELGTDSEEASALFRVLLKKLSQRDITFIITTHHKRLASLMSQDENVELVATLYDEKRERPTYTFLKGTIGKSYAFETAKRYGVPKDIINEAKRVYGEDKENLNRLIEKSISLELKMRQKIKKADRKLKEIEQKKENLEKQEERLKEQYRKAQATLENRYNAAINRAKEAIKVKESREGRRLLNKAHKFKTLSQNIDFQKQKEENISFKIGERVKYNSLNGEIIDIKKDIATVDIDGRKLRVSLSKLKLDSSTNNKIDTPYNNIKIEKPTKGSISINIIGKNSEDALEELEKFLSDAILSGFGEVEVIHGVGSGILKQRVKEYLTKNPLIDNFYNPKGNFGVTIVKL
jgi:DNA mismatch repair protein MutS2